MMDLLANPATNMALHTSMFCYLRGILEAPTTPLAMPVPSAILTQADAPCVAPRLGSR